MKKNTKKKNKNSSLLSMPRFTRPKLIVFVAIFAVIGAVALLISHALVSNFTGTFETGNCSQFTQGCQSTGPSAGNATTSVDTSRAYDGTYSLHASYTGGTQNAYARAVENVGWNQGDDVWYGEAVYLPVGFKAAMQDEVSLLRWDDYGNSAYGSCNSDNLNPAPSCDPDSQIGGVIINCGKNSTGQCTDLHARLKFSCYHNCPETILAGPWDIPEGQWNWIEVHQKLSTTDGQAINQVYMNGSLVGSSTIHNTDGYLIDRLRAGLVAIGAGIQTNPLNLWTDRVYIGSSQLGPAGTSSTTDTTPPSVSLTAPSNGSTVSGTVNLTANASDNIGVAGVQFKVDGQNLGSEDTTSPYGVSWNSAGVANGTHTITAVARDAAGNTSSSNASVTVSNTTTTTGGTTTTTSGGSTTTTSPYSLFYSTSSNFANATDLNGKTVSGYIYACNENGSSIKSARYFIDTTHTSGTPYHTENYAPFCLKGDGGSLSNVYAYNTRNLTNGQHFIVTSLTLTNGTTQLTTSTFTVKN